MNDYLWDKKGSDPDIEELENSLREFSASSYAPAQPKPEVVEQRTPFRDWLKLAFAVPALAALVLSALFYYRTEQQIQPVELAAEHAVPLVADKEPSIVEAPGTALPKRVSQSGASIKKRRATRSRVRTRNKKRKPALPRDAAPQDLAADVEPELTIEEQEAYAELMRALTITSEKLRLVRDKVQGPADIRGTK